jgi:uncharacterized FlaG/YvyC family protein
MGRDMEITPIAPAGAYKRVEYLKTERTKTGADPDRTISEGELRAAPKLDVMGTYARFVIRDGDVMIQIVDRAREEVLREIPPEEILRMAAELRAYQQALEAHRRRMEAGLTGKGGEL